MVGVIDIILDVLLNIFSENNNRKIDNSSLSTTKKNILRVLTVLVSLMVIMLLSYLLIKFFGNSSFY